MNLIADRPDAAGLFSTVDNSSLHRPLLFLHVPKTAGTSFLTLLRNLCGDNRLVRVEGPYDQQPRRLEAVMRGRRHELGCIAGHLPLHVCRPHLPHLRPFTMLRDPVARVLSLYRFLRTVGPAGLSQVGLTPGFSFEEFITCREPGTFRQVNNGMCRVLSGLVALDDPTTDGFWSSDLIGVALEQAMDFLRAVEFGLVEAMPQTLRLLRARWALPFAVTLPHANWTEPDDSLETAERLHRIAALNAADVALYHVAQRIMRERLADLDEGAPQDAAWTWQPECGRVTSVADIPGRQGFHDFEPDGNMAWLDSDATVRLHFRPPAGVRGAVRMALRVYMIAESYDAAQIGLHFNGHPVPVTVADAQGPWCTLTTTPLACDRRMQHLTIVPPYAVPVRFLAPASGDKRSLGVAVSTVTALAEA